MYARILKVQMQPGKVDEALELYQNEVGPAARQQTGFQQLLLLVNRQDSTGISISVWETLDDLAASEASGYLQEQLAKFTHIFVPDLQPVRETYEVGAQVS